MRLHTPLLALACAAALVACQPSTSEAPSEASSEITETPVAAPSEPAPQPLSAEDEARQRLQAVISGEHRAETDRARDIYRHPLETLSFFGLTPDATVIEITPGGGWYTDIIAPFLRTHGNYIGAIWDESLPDQPEYYARLNSTLAEKIAAAPGIYGEPELRRFDSSAPVFGPNESADMVLTFRNVHNWIPAGTGEAFFQAFYDVLKPGGVLGVVDHRAKDEGSTGGYVSEREVIDLASKAGFELVERSEINANPADTANYAKGVWTLPPTFALGDEDREKYAEIGESDRMTLKFVKPAAE